MPKSLSNHLIFALLTALLLAGCSSAAGTPVDVNQGYTAQIAELLGWMVSPQE
jgi:outer membrane protein assembly factor BamE (lipoprotein component of BamABCDE complex)